MAGSMKKGLLYGALLIAGVTLGMQLSEDGINETYSGNVIRGNQSGTAAVEQFTVPDVSSSQVSRPDEPGQALYEESVSDLSVAPEELLLPPPPGSAVDRLADKTAQLLQQASQRGIHWVASLFGPGEDPTQD